MSRIQATLLRRATTKEHLEVEYDDFCSKGERYALVRRLLLAELLLKMIHPIFSEEKSDRSDSLPGESPAFEPYSWELLYPSLLLASWR